MEFVINNRSKLRELEVRKKYCQGYHALGACSLIDGSYPHKYFDCTQKICEMCHEDYAYIVKVKKGCFYAAMYGSTNFDHLNAGPVSLFPTSDEIDKELGIKEFCDNCILNLINKGYLEFDYHDSKLILKSIEAGDDPGQMQYEIFKDKIFVKGKLDPEYRKKRAEILIN